MGGVISSHTTKLVAAAFSLLMLVNCAPGTHSAQLASTLDRSGASQDQSEIIGGQVVASNEDINSKVVQIRETLKYSKPLCTAIVIRQSVLLTAAHCVVQSKDQPSEVQARVRDGQDFAWVDVKQIEVYEGYDANKLEDGRDLALVFLKQALPSSYKPAVLATLPEDVSGLIFHVAGFGRTDEPYVEQPNHSQDPSASKATLQPNPSTRTEILRKTLLQPAQNTPEQQQLSALQTVLYFTQPDTGICSGDSGGALFARINGKYQIVGMASFVFNQKDESAPCAGDSAFTNISLYMPWIDVLVHTLDASENR